MTGEKQIEIYNANQTRTIELSDSKQYWRHQISIVRTADSVQTGGTIKIEVHPYGLPAGSWVPIDVAANLSLDKTESVIFPGVITAIRVTPTNVQVGDSYHLSWLGDSL